MSDDRRFFEAFDDFHRYWMVARSPDHAMSLIRAHVDGARKFAELTRAEAHERKCVDNGAVVFRLDECAMGWWHCEEWT